MGSSLFKLQPTSPHVSCGPGLIAKLGISQQQTDLVAAYLGPGLIAELGIPHQTEGYLTGFPKQPSASALFSADSKSLKSNIHDFR